MRRRKFLAAFVAPMAGCRSATLCRATLSRLFTGGARPAVPGRLEGAGFPDSGQASRNVDPESTAPGGDVPELEPLNGLLAQVGRQAQQDSQLGVHDRHGRGGHQRE